MVWQPVKGEVSFRRPCTCKLREDLERDNLRIIRDCELPPGAHMVEQIHCWM